MKTKNNILITGFIVTVIGAIFYSTKAILVKIAFKQTHIDALSLLFIRMLFALPFYTTVLFLKRKKLTILSTTQMLAAAALGVVGYYLSSLFDFIGLQFISAGLERLILFLYPTFAVLINTYLLKIKLSKKQLLALIITYVGIGIAYFGEFGKAMPHGNMQYGVFMVFLCAVTYSIYLVGTGKIVHSLGVSVFTAVAMLAATLGIMIHFFVTHSFSSLYKIDESIIWLGFALAFIATVLPSFMLSYGMKTIGSNNVAIIAAIGPVSTIIQAYFVLNEPLHFTQIMGTILVVCGVILIGWKTQETETID